jgi:AraC-like DNA-binding protein
MIALPLPLILSLIFGFLTLRLVMRGRPVPMLAALLGMLAVQALINALALHHGVALARLIQPVTAMAIPATAWLAWQADGLGRRLRRQDAAHGLGAAAALALRFHESILLDLLVPMTYAAYALALAASLRAAGPDLPRARLGEGTPPLVAWIGIAVALALSALSDIGIAAAIALGHAAHAPTIVDLASSVLLLGIGGLALTAERLSVGETTEEDPAPAPTPSEDDHALFARLVHLMETRSPWRDPDLTLAQLGRPLQTPAKQLSAAVNRVTGDNISRFVNSYRVRAACAALERGATASSGASPASPRPSGRHAAGDPIA